MALKKCFENCSAFFPALLLLRCHRTFYWHGCQAYIKALNRYMSSQAGRELEIWLQAVLGLPAPLPPCHGALPGLPVVQPGCPYLLWQERALWHIAVGLKLEVTEVGGYLMALNSEIII